MNNAQLNRNTTVSFTLQNSVITTSSCIFVNHASGGTTADYQVWANTISAGSCVISVRNIVTNLDLTEAIVLNFVVLGITTA